MKSLKCIALLMIFCSLIVYLISCSAAEGVMNGIGAFFADGIGGDIASGGGVTLKGESGIPVMDSSDGDDSSESSNDNTRLPSGMITAGAFSDNDNYSLWLEQFAQGKENGKFYNYTLPENSWGYNSLQRVKVNVTDGENAVAGARVIANDADGNILFSAVTDARGDAYLFTDAQSGTVTVIGDTGNAVAEFGLENRNVSVLLDNGVEKLNVIEIMLVVDVTGSMGDEIDFLKAELADVIDRIATNNSGAKIKLAMLFYRDTEDHVPFDYYDFVNVTEDAGLVSQQRNLDKQFANGGGDYPEAVDEALDIAVNKQWSTGATTKIIFQVLDAPAHTGKQYAEKLVNATKIAAEKGIRVCPIICSGAAESTEYTMREAAIYTGGTFVFVTNDSGIGGDHYDPNLPNVTVELLNSLMVRLVNGYHTGEFAPPVYWKNDPNLNTINK